MNGVSVIICCYNSSDKLPETLYHISQQQLTAELPVEVILVDNGSTDTTCAVASAYWEQVKAPYPLRIISETIPGKNYAIETGISAAAYDLILFCDDDNLLSADYIQRGYTYFLQHPALGLLGGFGIPRLTIAPPPWFERYAYQYALGPQHTRARDITLERGYVYGAGSILKKEAYLTLKKKGFQYTLTGRRNGIIIPGEDNELGYAVSLIGYQIHSNPELTFIHVLSESRLTWAYIKRLKKSVAYSAALLIPYTERRNERLLNKKSTFSWTKKMLSECFYFLNGYVRYPFAATDFKTDIVLDRQARLGSIQSLFANRKLFINKHSWLPWLQAN
jgi:glycosyltransferase involved in cell wall biosynthesis